MHTSISLVLGLASLAGLSSAQDSETSGNVGQLCSVQNALPFIAVSFPVKDGEGILEVVAKIVDPIAAGSGLVDEPSSIRDSGPIRRRQLVSDDSMPGGDVGATSAPTVPCTVHEVCLVTDAGNAFCYDTMLSAFNDTLGTTGNAITGDYVLLDGEKGNLFDGPHPGFANNSTADAQGAKDAGSGPKGGMGLVAAAAAAVSVLIGSML